VNYQHKGLSKGHWGELAFVEQMANIGSEVIRAINWKKKGRQEYSNLAFERALELLDLTLTLDIRPSCLKELARLREILADYFVFDNIYNSTDEKWQEYFLAFNYAARLNS